MFTQMEYLLNNISIFKELEMSDLYARDCPFLELEVVNEHGSYTLSKCKRNLLDEYHGCMSCKFHKTRNSTNQAEILKHLESLGF